MLNYETYYNDYNKISNSFHGFHLYTNTLNEIYMKKLWNYIYLKYKNVNNPNETFNTELRDDMYFLKNYFSLKIYLYYLITSHSNIIQWFVFYNKIYKPAKYRKQREIEFHNYVKTLIERLDEGLKLNISVPYIIVIKFLNQINSMRKFKYLLLSK